MINNILISVIIPSYNRANTVGQTIESIISQKVDADIEIVIGDDCSTDNAREVLLQYKEKYPDIIKPIYETENQYSKHDGSLGRIMNAAVDATGAKYVAMCEGDDYWTDPLKLQKQVDFLEANEEYSMCFHGAEIKIQGVDRSIYGARCEYVQDKEYWSTDLFAEWIVPTASIVYDRQRVNQYAIKHPEWATRGDIILVLKCAHTGKVWGMSDKMSVYRVQPNGVTYDQIRRTAEIDKLPNHFRCIYYNFPKVNKDAITWNISHAYYSRMKIGLHLTGKISDFFKFIVWTPKFAYSKIKGLIKRKTFK